MSEIQDLRDALMCLSKSVSNFPIGAISLEDFKPVEEKIKNTRESLKHLNARLLILKAQNEFQAANDEPEEDTRKTVANLHEATANALINDAAIKLCLHSYTIQAILMGREGDSDMQKKIYNCMRKLFSLNDDILSIQEEIEEALQQQLELKIECQNALFDYNNFLKEQEEIRAKRLQETNPKVALNKEKTDKTLRNINVMKKLIINFIAASNHMLKEDPDLVQMLEDHRETVNIETILKISQNTAENDENTHASQ